MAKLKESFIVNSLWVSGYSIGIKNVAKLYPGVFIADKIGQILASYQQLVYGF